MTEWTSLAFGDSRKLYYFFLIVLSIALDAALSTRTSFTDMHEQQNRKLCHLRGCSEFLPVAIVSLHIIKIR